MVIKVTRQLLEHRYGYPSIYSVIRVVVDVVLPATIPDYDSERDANTRPVRYLSFIERRFGVQYYNKDDKSEVEQGQARDRDPTIPKCDILYKGTTGVIESRRS